MSERKITVRLHDTHVGIWQDNPSDPSFKPEIFDGLLKAFRRRGWSIKADPTAKRYRSISPCHRVIARGDLRAAVSVNGRALELMFWAETWPVDNRNGRRYDFGKRERMTFLDRLRVELETRRVVAWLRERAIVTVSDKIARGFGPGRGQGTAAAYIARDYAESWHTDKALGHPPFNADYNRRSRDGALIPQGATVWFRDRKGCILRGVAHYRLNSMWTVTVGRYGLHHLSCGEIFVACPPDLRRKRNERERRKRLEGELALAIRAMRFPRAEVVRKVLFGDRPTYGIWARDHDAYYRADYAGYTTDSISAGRYTWDEAAREVRRVPHELSLVLPDGSHLSAHELDRARAA